MSRDECVDAWVQIDGRTNVLQRYFATMPWLAMPYLPPAHSERLFKMFKLKVTLPSIMVDKCVHAIWHGQIPGALTAACAKRIYKVKQSLRLP